MQKKAPFAVWQVELFDIPGLIEQGRKKYNTLLRHYASRQATDQPNHQPSAASVPQLPAARAAGTATPALS